MAGTPGAQMNEEEEEPTESLRGSGLISSPESISYTSDSHRRPLCDTEVLARLAGGATTDVGFETDFGTGLGTGTDAVVDAVADVVADAVADAVVDAVVDVVVGVAIEVGADVVADVVVGVVTATGLAAEALAPDGVVLARLVGGSAAIRGVANDVESEIGVKVETRSCMVSSVLCTSSAVESSLGEWVEDGDEGGVDD